MSEISLESIVFLLTKTGFLRYAKDSAPRGRDTDPKETLAMEPSLFDSSFLSPPDFYRGTDFWMLNDKLEDEELVRQLREMKKAGV